MYKITLYCIVLSITVCSGKFVLPEDLRKNPCNRYSQSLNGCLLRRFRTLIPHLAKGFDNPKIEPLDPLRVPYFEFEGPRINDLDFKAKLTNTTVLGHKNTEILAVMLNSETLEGTIDVFIPHIHISTYYDSFGKFGKFPLIDIGYFEGQIWNASFKAKFKLDEITRGSETYFIVDSTFLTTATSRRAQIKLESSVKHAEWLGVLISNYFNANYEFLSDILKPHVQVAAGKFYAMAVTHIMREIPAKEFLRF